MIFHYMGKYSGNPDDLPYTDHEPGAVAFKEPQSMTKLALLANGLAIVIMILMFVIMFARTEEIELTFVGIGLAVLSMLPHELLHAICFKKDVYLYTNLSKGLLFVVGTERMSKARFIILGMLPNIVFGFIPFALYLINPNWTTLGSMGAICIAMGAGDYMNVFNALTQMPKGACCYLHKLNTFWYMPEETNEKTY